MPTAWAAIFPGMPLVAFALHPASPCLYTCKPELFHEMEVALNQSADVFASPPAGHHT